MANIKWSAFPTEAISVSGDKLVGLHSGLNYQITSVGVPNGGTGNATLAAYELIAGGTTSTGALQSIPLGNSNQVLMSQGAGSLAAYSTATYPPTTTINQILYSSANNTVAGLATANSSMLSTSSSGVPAWSASMTNGQIMIGSTGATPAPATLTAGANISITNGAGSITISAGTDVIVWAANSSSSFTAAVGNGYILTSGSSTTVTLPTTFAVGSIIGIAGQGAAWTVDIGAATNVKAFGNTYTTSFASANNSDVLVLLATVANTTWVPIQMVTTGFTAS